MSEDFTVVFLKYGWEERLHWEEVRMRRRTLWSGSRAEEEEEESVPQYSLNRGQQITIVLVGN